MRDHPASEAAAQAGLAHVASASFLASRVVPTGGYAVALAGGVALARAAQVAGTRIGYGVSVAAMLQTVAVLGPSRVGVPLTQALSAPLLGRMQARGARLAAQIAACAAIRAAHQALTALFYILVIAGGVVPYAATFDALAGRLPGVPDGPAAALAATALGLVAWTAFASVVQVLVYRAALREWPRAAMGGPPARAGRPCGGQGAPGGRTGAPPPAPPEAPAGARYDPRAVAVAAVVGFCVLVATTAWLVLLAVAAWLTIAWATARADGAPVPAGLALTALLAGGALVFGLVGDVGLDLTLRRTVRAALLVLVATWLRAAAGEDGLREVAHRSLWVLRGVPAMSEASAVLDRLGAGGGLGASGRALVEQVRHVRRRPSSLAAAVLRWIASEADGFRASRPRGDEPVVLRARWRDRVLVAAVIAATAGAVVAG